MNISHLDKLNLENIEPKIIDLINEYKHSIESYELNFFQNLPDYIDERYLNMYYHYDFKKLFQEEISLDEKLHILNELDIEISDIQNNDAIEVKYTHESYFFKWKMFKSNIFENHIDTTAIRHFKHYMLVSKKNKRINKEDEFYNFTFTLDEIIKIATSNCICLHCILKDFMNQTNETDNNFINELREKFI